MSLETYLFRFYDIEQRASYFKKKSNAKKRDIALPASK